jgi:hypothetical protein
MRRSTWFVVGLVVLVAAGVFVAGSAVRAEEGEEGGAMPAPQKKVDHALAKAVLGTWEWTGGGHLEGAKGTIGFALGIGDTAVIEDVQGTVKMGEQMAPFAGHAVWKIGEDGSLKVWWFDSFSAEPDLHEGTITADGYRTEGPSGAHVLKKSADGFVLDMGGAATITLKK